MDEQTNPTTMEEPTATRRVIAKGVAATGLAALFASVATGRVLADHGADDDLESDDSPDTSPDTSPDLDDSADTTPDGVDEADTTPDDGETTADEAPSPKTAVKGTSRKRGRHGHGKKKGRG